MRFLFLESFYGGSHKEFADGLTAHCRYRIDLLTMPARFWKWRMRGASLYFLNKIHSFSPYDGIVATDLISLSDLKALSEEPLPPVMLYFHENQLTYPLAPGEIVDYQFGFTDITSALAASRVVFNSQSHLDAFFEKLPAFLKMMPDCRPNWVMEAIRKKAGVLYPGCRFPDDGIDQRKKKDPGAPPLIIWNHRWEFDKDPGTFFDVLHAVASDGIDFRLALLGENFTAVPEVFHNARRALGKRVVCFGYEPDRKKYIDWLGQGDVVVSTAHQENFGIAVVEAIRHGCLPLLPRRLVYPEILPASFHEKFLYDHPAELKQKLAWLLTCSDDFSHSRGQLSAAMDRFSWKECIGRYENELEALAGMALPSPRVGAQRNSRHGEKR